MTHVHDLAVVGGGIHGATVALFAARGGMDTTLVERGALCRAASGVNAGTLTMQMTRVALIPYAMEGHRMWATAGQWLGHDVGVRVCDGLSLAYTEAEEALLSHRAKLRREAGAPIELVRPDKAASIEPGLGGGVRLAGHCTVDGYANAYLTGLAYRKALLECGVALHEGRPANGLTREDTGFALHTGQGTIRARQIVLAGGVWLETMLGWLGISLPIKTLINQLAVTERIAPVMRTVIGVASGLLSLKQFPHGTTVIGGGWQALGDRETGKATLLPDRVIGNARLAIHTIPALAKARLVRAWTGFEAETADAMPIAGPVPGIEGAFVCGCVHSGYTSGPYIARLLADRLLGKDPAMPLFPMDRLLTDGHRIIGDAA
jgi:sarcosine oxidase subunit beta